MIRIGMQDAHWLWKTFVRGHAVILSRPRDGQVTHRNHIKKRTPASQSRRVRSSYSQTDLQGPRLCRRSLHEHAVTAHCSDGVPEIVCMFM